MTETTLVTGATGTVGRALVARLTDDGVAVRAAVHSPDSATGLPPGVETVVIDMTDPATLAPAFDGVERAYLLTPFVPDQVSLVRNLVAAARDAGVSYLVRQSAIGAGDPEPPYTFAAEHREAERVIEESGIAYTHLRPTAFCQNLLNDAETVRSEGAIYNPVVEAISFVDARDVASVAAAVLTEDGHAGEAYDLTGPEAVTYGEIAAVLSEHLGREVEHVEVSMDDTREALREAGMPDELAEGYLSLLRWFEAGGGGETVDTVERLTGTPALPFETFARDHLDAFR